MTTSLVRARVAGTDDLGAVHALYENCSPATLEQRFHVPVRHLSERMVAGLVAPRGGWSIVVEQHDEVIGHGCAGPLSSTRVEIGLVVDDAFQGTGVGTRLVRELGRTATERGFHAMVCVVDPDNTSVLPTVRRAGFHVELADVDGLLEIDVPLASYAEVLRPPA